MAVAVGADGSDPLCVSDACCTTLACCEQVADPRRARDWSQAIADFARRRNFLPVTAWCGAIHAGFLVLTGQWAEAERVLDRALAEADRLPAGDRGTVRAVLAALRVRQGRLREAADLLAGCEDRPAALEPLVAVHLAAGDVDLAEERVERRLATAPQPAHLALRAAVRLARGDAEGAAAAAAALAAAAERAGRDDLAARAVVLAARAAHTGVPHVPRAPREERAPVDPAALEDAAATLAALELPLEEAEARMELARALAGGHPALAVEEARRALSACDRLGAARHADAAAALLRELGAPGRPAPRTADVLTRREQEVLGLLAEGCSNGEIARRLVISDRTAEHHVRAILRKLDLRNRAEAAVYAARAGS
jgi:DNA-binding CsgD family transcriptional regulator